MMQTDDSRGYTWRIGLKVIAILLLGLVSGAQETAAKGGVQDGQPAAASSTAASSASLQPPAVPVQTELGEAMELERKGKFDPALQKYQLVLQTKPKSPDAWAGISRCYLKKGDVVHANETATKGLEINDSWPTRVALGEVYFRRGKISEAEKEWLDVIRAGHPAARAYLGLARVRWAIEMNKTAKTMIDKAHELDASDPDIQRYWTATLPRGEQIKQYESSLADPNNLSADERADLQSYLAYLKDREKHNTSCRLVSQVRQTETPLVRLLLDPTHLRAYGLTVELNGTRANLLLDTGASGIVVKQRLAERAGIEKVTEQKMSGVGDKGPKNGYRGTAKSIRIGKMEFQDCSVDVIEGRSVVGEDGLIGADVFESFLVDIDFPKELLRLSELPKRPGETDHPITLVDTGGGAGGATTSVADEAAADERPATPQDRYIAPEMQSYTRVLRFGHDLLVPTKIGDVAGKLFLLDTGAFNNSISPAAAREVTKVHNDPDTIVKGISGSVKNVYTANKAVLQFGHLRQENQELTAFDTVRFSEDDGIEVSGFLGFVMLHLLDIKIDYRDALVDFTYGAGPFGR